MMDADSDETANENEVEGKRNESAFASSHCHTVGPKGERDTPPQGTVRVGGLVCLGSLPAWLSSCRV